MRAAPVRERRSGSQTAVVPCGQGSIPGGVSGECRADAASIGLQRLRGRPAARMGGRSRTRRAVDVPSYLCTVICDCPCAGACVRVHRSKNAAIAFQTLPTLWVGSHLPIMTGRGDRPS